MPLFAITNFSADFWAPFRRARDAFFRRFRDIVVSGEVKLLKPDPAIYHLALDRFGLRPDHALFVDDRKINVEGAEAVGMQGHLLTDAEDLRRRLEKEGLLYGGWIKSGMTKGNFRPLRAFHFGDATKMARKIMDRPPRPERR